MKAVINPSPDIASKRFWENNERFADLFNAVLFQGRTVIQPELLTERNTDVSASIPVGRLFEHVKKYEDVTKYFRGTELTILAVEGQKRIHYAMPLRNRLYDDLDYLNVCMAVTGVHWQLKDLHDADEFLSGITKEDKLPFSIRIVVYYGEKEWDGARKLSEMFLIPDEFRPYFQDYTMSLVEICSPENAEIPYRNKSVCDLMTQLRLIYEKNWEEIRRQDVSVDRDTAMLIAAVAKEHRLADIIPNAKGEVRMCEALEEFAKENQEIGKQIGQQIGEIRGEIKGCKKGIELAFDIMDRLKQNPVSTDSEIAAACDCEEALVKKVRSRM